MDKRLTLPDFLKLLTSNSVPVPKAMAIASKVFKEYNTPTLLVQLDDAKLQVLGVKDKDLRKLFLTAVRNAGDSQRTRKTQSEGDANAQLVAAPSSNTVQTLVTPRTRKRRRDDDLNELLPEALPDEASTFGSMDFNDVLDEEVLKVKSTVINRAPLMTAWATIVAEQLGFEREEALSIGSVYTEMNAVAKGVSLGIVDQSRQKEMDLIKGERQPYVDLMGQRIPLYKTQSSKWRALISGSPAIPSAAFSYISRAFRQTTPYVVGALRLLATSYPPQELNKIGFPLYAEFRPAVDGWGKRGEVQCERILSLRKKGGGGTLDTPASGVQRSDSGSQAVVEHPSEKKSRLEEYEASLAVNSELDGEKLCELA